jgi:hypothetical protein
LYMDPDNILAKREFEMSRRKVKAKAVLVTHEFTPKEVGMYHFDSLD